MAYTDVTWAMREAITSAKLQLMADNEAYLKDRVDNMAWGVLGRVQLNTSQSSTATEWDVPGLSLTGVSIGANRTIRASCSWRNLGPQGMVGIWAVQIKSGNSVLTEQWVRAMDNLQSTNGGTLFVTGTSTTAISKDYKVTVKRIFGTGVGNFLYECSNTARAELVVEDIGPSM